MMLSNELLKFVQSDDADDIVMAFNRLEGPSRKIMVDHIVAMSGLSAVIEGAITQSALPAPEAHVAPTITEEALLPDWLSARERKIIGSLTAETVENRILQMKLRNMSIDRISAYMDMDRTQVVAILREHQKKGVRVGPMGDYFKQNPKKAAAAASRRNKQPKTTSRSFTTPEQRTEIVGLRNKGVGPARIALAMELSPPTVYNVLYHHKKETGIEFPEIDPNLSALEFQNVE